jgi:DNA-binding transcriptional LysR family regulator
MVGEIELRHLRYFVVLAEELSFTRAARRLAIAQPSLSLQIRQLEARLGTALLVRQPRVTLTATGTTFLASARRVLRYMQQTLVAAERLSGGTQAVLEVGMASSAALRNCRRPVLRKGTKCMGDIASSCLAHGRFRNLT